ncbi:MAG: carbon-nitrogen hydrolase family protein [Pseudonocardiaceae bacterium]
MPTLRRDGITAVIVQSRIDQGERDNNWNGARTLLTSIQQEPAPGLIVFPEAFSSGVNFIILRQMAEPIPDGPTTTALANLARETGAHIVAGVLEDGGDRKVYDSALVLDPAGELIGLYRRRFMWVGERNYVTAGDRPVVVATALGRIGLIVGYDLCFPEATASFLTDEVDVIACPASVFAQLNYNAVRLARTRAMDSHCYFLYANAVGFHQFANMAYTGGSGIFVDPYFLQVQLGAAIDPELGTVSATDGEPAVVTGLLHLDDLRAARLPTRLPFRGDAAYCLGDPTPATVPTST